MNRRKGNAGTKRQIVWVRWVAGTLAVIGVALLVFLGPGSILSDGKPEEAIIGLDDEATAAAIPGDTGGHDEPLLSLPAAPSVSSADFERDEADGDIFVTNSVTEGFSSRSERIDLDQIRSRLQSGERVEDTQGDPGWEHEIAVGRRGSLRIGYEPAGGSEAKDPLSGTLEAEFVVDLFGKASVSAGYRFLNFRDLEGNHELRDALARAQVQVRF